MSEPMVRIGRERIGSLTTFVGLFVGLLIAAGCGAGSSASPTSSPSNAPSGVVASLEDAVSAIVVERPDFADIGPFDPNRIGGCCWYRVATDGTVELVDEGGDPVPPGGIPSDGS